MENNQNSNASNNNQQKSSHGCAIAFFCFIAIALVVFLCIYFFIIKPTTSEKNSSTSISGSGQYYDDEDKHDYPIYKSAPKITGEQRLDGIDISIYCTDDYNLVEVKVTLYDDNDKVLDTETLQGRNYSKGNTYKLQYRPSLSTMWNASSYRLSVTKYN